MSLNTGNLHRIRELLKASEFTGVWLHWCVLEQEAPQEAETFGSKIRISGFNC